jgi:hypothetical protein
VGENPFKQEERLYPSDYGSAWKNDLNISIQIPEGYTIVSKPIDFALTLPDNLGTYILKTEVVNNKINAPINGANHYNTLKGLNEQAIDKQLEKIVLVQSQP